VHAHQSKFFLDGKPSYTLGFSFFLFCRFPFFSSPFVFAAVFGLLPAGFFPVEEFPRKRKRTTNHGQAKGRKDEFSSEFFAKILKRFGAYFRLHQSNHAGLGIIGKVDVAFLGKI